MFYIRVYPKRTIKNSIFAIEKYNMDFFDISDQYFWLKVASLVISAVSSTCAIILALKKRKIKFSELINNLFSWIEEAETHDSYTGSEKLEFVLNRAFKYCTTNHIAYHEDKVTDEIERIIALSKSVNAETVEKKLNPAITGK